MNLLLKELKKFSKNNWFVYIVLFLCLIIIYITGKGNIFSILIFFLVYFFAELIIMVMVTLIEDKKYKLASIFQILSVTIFTSLFVYNYLGNGQIHYVFASITFWMSAIKNLFKFNFDIDLKYINGFSTFLVGIIFMIFGYIYNLFIFDIQIIFQYIGFILFPTSLIMTDKYKKLKYFIGIIGLLGFVIGSGYGVYSEFLRGEVLGVTICFTLMPATVLLVYLKNLKKYLI